MPKIVPPPLVETHAHLTDEQFDADREDVLARARTVGVTTFIEIGEQESQWSKARAFSESHIDVFWTAGQHPYYANQVDDDFIERLKAMVDHPRCVAVGEIGLDYHREDSLPAVQRRALGRLLAAARDKNKPVILHCRDAHPTQPAAQRDLLAILREMFPVQSSPLSRPVGRSHAALLASAVGAPSPEIGRGNNSQPNQPQNTVELVDVPGSNVPLPTVDGKTEIISETINSRMRPVGVAHCFQGSAENALALVDLGFLIGVDAPITYPRAEALRNMVKAIPLDALVLETDSPYLPPQSHRGKRNEPCHLPAVAMAVAALHGVSAETISLESSDNAKRLFLSAW